MAVSLSKTVRLSLTELSINQGLCHNRGLSDNSTDRVSLVIGQQIAASRRTPKDLMTDRELEEYKALRATILQRGTVRTCVFVAGLAAWAVVSAATQFVTLPFFVLVPLLLLAATFEAVFALHVGVERIGRYLQVFHDDGWERTAMAFGAPLAGTGSDPLFVVLFGLAACCNLLPVVLAPPASLAVALIAGAHALFFLRLLAARQVARRQRAADLARFRALKEKGDGSHFTDSVK
jgi:hypothetical protein